MFYYFLIEGEFTSDRFIDRKRCLQEAGWFAGYSQNKGTGKNLLVKNAEGTTLRTVVC